MNGHNLIGSGTSVGSTTQFICGISRTAGRLSGVAQRQHAAGVASATLDRLQAAVEVRSAANCLCANLAR